MERNDSETELLEVSHLFVFFVVLQRHTLAAIVLQVVACGDLQRDSTKILIFSPPHYLKHIYKFR